MELRVITVPHIKTRAEAEERRRRYAESTLGRHAENDVFDELLPRAMNHAAAPPGIAQPATWRGKTYGELRAMERHQLKIENRALFDRMRKPWCEATGAPIEMERIVRAGARILQPVSKVQSAPAVGSRRYEQLKPMERHVLKRDNPKAFDALRSDWVKRGGPVE